jgi:outer membrane protein OmpA-like peptidoglycan-associated protein
MARRALVVFGMVGAVLPTVGWAQSSSPALSAEDIAKMLKPGVELTSPTPSAGAPSSDVISADDIAAVLKPASSPAGATRSLSAGTGAAPAAAPQNRTVSLQVNFASGSTKISPQARQQLDQLGRALQYPELEDLQFEIAGHTDAVGSAEANKRLSQKRAEAVVGYLVEAYSITPNRLEAVGYGEEVLVDPSNPNSGKNRRVEVKAE